MIECCEPDARKRPCDECGARAGVGYEEALLMGRLDLTDGEEAE